MSKVIEERLPDGTVAVFHQYGGFNFPDHMVRSIMPAETLDEQMKWVKETEIRDDDVLIFAYPKTGTHWIWEITNMVLQGSAEYNSKIKEAAMLEFRTPEMISSLQSPRVLNTHLTLDFLPENIREKKTRIILIWRNPKDTCISLYFHLVSELKSINKMPPPIRAMMMNFRGAVGIPRICSYSWFIQQWDQFQTANKDHPVYNIFYEELIKNPQEQIKKLAGFLGKDIDDKLLEEIATKCQFQNLKQAHNQKELDLKTNATGDFSFIYRKGQIGDWKNYFINDTGEDAESRAFDTWINTALKDCNIITADRFMYE